MSTPFPADPTLGALLRQHRLLAGLTQEALAERAGLSPRGVQLLERGLRTSPRAETLRLLADALDLDAPARAALIAATHPALAATPAPAAPGLRPVRPPVPPTPLVAREGEIAATCALLQPPGHTVATRLLTLTGPGGVGKTRLALEIAAALHACFPGGATWADLAPLGDPALVPGVIAAAFGIRDDSEAALLAALQRVEQPLLLVLDNCEHLLPAMPLVATLLAASPHLAVLATSRARLRLRGEREFPLGPLALPGTTATATLPLTELSRVAAVRLFVARASEVNPDFALSPDNAAAVAAICRQVDGLPLALELAAARIKLLPPAALLSRLQQRLTFLAGGARDLPPRHQTLRDTIAWSHGLLTPAEQILFHRLAVFAGGFTVAAMETMGDLEALTALADQSLLRPMAATSDEPRWTMLETVREFARECLAESGEEDHVRRTHASHFLALAERAEPQLTGPEQTAWLDRLELEHDNLRAALAWAVPHDPGMALRLAGALWRFWYVRGYLREGHDWAEAALAQPGGSLTQRAAAYYTAGDLAQEQGDYDEAAPRLAAGLAAARQAQDPGIAARCLSSLAFIARNQGAYDDAESYLQQALVLQRELGDVRAIACTLGNLGSLAQNRGAEAEATQLLAEALVSFRGLGDLPMAADILANLAILANQQGEPARAARFAEEALGTYRTHGDRQGAATALVAVANAARGEGDLLEARTLYEEALDLFREVHHQPGSVSTLTHLATLALDTGDTPRALPLLADTLRLLQRTGDERAIATALAATARALAALGHWEQAGRLAGAAIALRATPRTPLPLEDADQRHLANAASHNIGEAAWATAVAAGRALPQERALTEALAGIHLQPASR
ncbi:MAG: tetratricopeptide repeat protein [Thermomicrobiales bacterium]